jgi:thiol-disulfide isomerase/thioredoxin
MKNITIALTVGAVLLSIVGLVYLGTTLAVGSATDALPASRDESASVRADRVEVVNFFATQRCVSCLTLGRLAKETVAERFSEEVAAGRVTFIEVNGELPQNRDMVLKYQAAGSSLYINAITGGQDSIELDASVWRLLNDERQFKDYLAGKIAALLQ